MAVRDAHVKHIIDGDGTLYVRAENTQGVVQLPYRTLIVQVCVSVSCPAR